MTLPVIWQLGGSWLSTAKMLKLAADNLLVDYQAAYEQLTEISTGAINHGTVVDLNRLPPNLELYCSYALLMGYAIENLIKGIIVCDAGITDPNFGGVVNFEDFRAVNRDDGRPWRIDTHGFLKLLKATAIRDDFFTDVEKETLRYLDKVVVWGGRYPVPKRQDPVNPFDLVCVEPISSPIPVIAGIYAKALSEMHRVGKEYGN